MLEEQKKNLTGVVTVYDHAIVYVGVVAAILNLAVVVSSGLILKKVTRQQSRTTYMLLGNVALTDLTCALANIFGHPSENTGRHMCSLQLAVIVSSAIVSIYSIGLIAIDRFLYIVHGMHYQRWVYTSRTRIWILFVWILGCFVGCFPWLGWTSETEKVHHCWFVVITPKVLVSVIIVMGFVPILLVIVLYSIILHRALKNVKKLNPQRRENQLEREVSINTKMATPKKWKAIKVVMFTTACFVFTWGPYFVACGVYVCTTDKQFGDWLSVFISSYLALLGFGNTLINPLIYAWWHKGFRAFIDRQFNLIKSKRSNSNFSSVRNTYLSDVSFNPVVVNVFN